MTGLHDSFQRSEHGAFILSPHGRFNSPVGGRWPAGTDLLIVLVTDESVGGTGLPFYVGLEEGAAELGQHYWDTHINYWETYGPRHNVVLVRIQPTGVDYPNPLEPGGVARPEPMYLTSHRRPITEITQVSGAIDQAVNHFRRFHDDDLPHVQAIGVWIDNTVSMTVGQFGDYPLAGPALGGELATTWGFWGAVRDYLDSRYPTSVGRSFVWVPPPSGGDWAGPRIIDPWEGWVYAANLLLYTFYENLPRPDSGFYNPP